MTLRSTRRASHPSRALSMWVQQAHHAHEILAPQTLLQGATANSELWWDTIVMASNMLWP